jgi:N-acyl-D-aspartate/D-glutamate deacylase
VRATTLILALCAISLTAQQPDRYDLLIRHGTLIDGSGAPMYRGDVAVSNGVIVRVGEIANATASEEVDASGLYVTPGFINLHSHAAPNALSSAVNMLTQGVTFELLNADGGGRIDIAQQLQQAAADGLALNVGANIGFNSAWTATVGEADRRPTAEEIARMREILTSNLEAGAWGVSAGLDYKPAYYASAEEVVEVVKAAAPWRTNFTNHDRLTPETKYSSRAAIAETIGIGSRAGLVPIITHMKVQGREQGSAGAVLNLMSDATRRGNYTAADAYPYLAGQTGLGALLVPGWAQDGGREAMLERFKDPALRTKIIAEAEEAMSARFGGPEGVFLPATRRELTDVMREMNVGAGEAVIRLLEADNQGAILRFGSEDDLVKILQHPTTSVACDCGASLPGRGSHPRNQGTYPRVLGRYVRETKALTWEDAVRKMTLLPATTIGMVDRGALAAGMAADITVFDPATVIDRATYADPSLPSEGIRHVVVNGVIALRDGRPTGAKAGQVLRRTRAMPSRPMNASNVGRRLEARGSVASATGDTWQVSVDIEQRSGRRLAGGDITLRDRERREIGEVEALGVLQTWNAWASVTGSLRISATGERRPIVLVVEQADPWRADRASSITLYSRSADGAATEMTGRAERVRITSR